MDTDVTVDDDNESPIACLLQQTCGHTSHKAISVCVFFPLLSRELQNNMLSFMACETIDNLPDLKLV